MKKLFVKMLAIFILVNVSAVSAQKLGHVDLDSLISLMPEFKAAKEKSEGKLKSLEGFLMNLKNEYDQKAQIYQTNYATMSEMEKKDMEEQLSGMQQRIQSRQVEAQTEYQTYSNNMMKPIYDKAKKAIEKVAKANGYKYIFDTAVGNILYSEPGDDVLQLVKKEMDAMPAAKLPDGGASTNDGMGKPGGNGTNPKPGGTKPKPGGK
jgi:outer membrane protein